MTSASATPTKFNFDLDMGLNREKTQVVTEQKLLALIEDARTAAYQEGHAAGEQSTQARAAEALANGAANIAQQGVSLLGAADTMRKSILGESVHLARTIASKIATKTLEKHPTGELDTLIKECMSSIDEAPHLVIRCNPELADAVREIAEEKMNTSGFSGRLIIMGEPDIALGDGRLEWVDGGIVRDRTTIAEQIDQNIDAYLSAEGLPAAKETEDE